MSESERITRIKRINKRLKSHLLKWSIIPYKTGMNTSVLDAHAVEEFPTETGPVDYALFVKGKLLAMIEAKRLGKGVENVLEQTKR
nr:hypothetical protein [Candidatus Bathyarchaeota archaeon]